MRVALATIVAMLVGSLSIVLAIQAPDTPERFDSLVVGDPAAALDVAPMPAASLPSPARAGWDGFRAARNAAEPRHPRNAGCWRETIPEAARSALRSQA